MKAENRGQTERFAISGVRRHSSDARRNIQSGRCEKMPHRLKSVLLNFCFLAGRDDSCGTALPGCRRASARRSLSRLESRLQRRKPGVLLGFSSALVGRMPMSRQASRPTPRSDKQIHHLRQGRAAPPGSCKLLRWNRLQPVVFHCAIAACIFSHLIVPGFPPPSFSTGA